MSYMAGTAYRKALDAMGEQKMNKAVKDIMENPKITKKSRPIAPRYFNIREAFQEKQVKLTKIPSNQHTPDIFTKALGTEKMNRFLNDILNTA